MLPRAIAFQPGEHTKLIDEANRNLLFVYAGRWAFVALLVLLGIKVAIGYEQAVFTSGILVMELALVLIAAFVAIFFRRAPGVFMLLGLLAYAIEIGVWASLDAKTFIEGFFLKAGVFGVATYALFRLYSFRQNEKQLQVLAKAESKTT